MSTRWYPLYQKGNPQLRIFLPNFWMKMVKPDLEQRKNIVHFHCSMEMTRHDIKNYLEKIYKVPVIKVNTRIALGTIRENELGTIVKDDDIKIAYVHLPRYEKFEYPNLFETDQRKKEKEKEDSIMEETKAGFQAVVEENNKTQPGLPPWFRNF
ncbi:39S ribosomal protein L23, mitochondrial [Copidosoma floridanum]|uniref:39S ribosomal protein L23, mitochondrial n=1 Tax=Copidosoma floridanum TaxID=29053 RepID=UPI0006C94C41|nr:39S ribosomal protein L23, mitochondrial [Copidosoma floridanum]